MTLQGARGITRCFFSTRPKGANRNLSDKPPWISTFRLEYGESIFYLLKRYYFLIGVYLPSEAVPWSAQVYSNFVSWSFFGRPKVWFVF